MRPLQQGFPAFGFELNGFLRTGDTKRGFNKLHHFVRNVELAGKRITPQGKDSPILMH